MMAMALSAGFDRLPVTEQIRLMHGFGVQQIKIADHFGLSRQRVHCIVRNNYQKIRFRRLAAAYREYFRGWRS